VLFIKRPPGQPVFFPLLDSILFMPGPAQSHISIAEDRAPGSTDLPEDGDLDCVIKNSNKNRDAARHQGVWISVLQ